MVDLVLQAAAVHMVVVQAEELAVQEVMQAADIPYTQAVVQLVALD
jgi:hypothetical protein